MDPANTRFRPELVDPTACIAPGAVVLGDVTIGAEVERLVRRGDSRRHRRDPHRPADQHSGRLRAACRPGFPARWATA